MQLCPASNRRVYERPFSDISRYARFQKNLLGPGHKCFHTLPCFDSARSLPQRVKQINIGIKKFVRGVLCLLLDIKGYNRLYCFFHNLQSVSNKALKDSPASMRSIASPKVSPTDTTSIFVHNSRLPFIVSVMKSFLMGEASMVFTASPESTPCVAIAYTSFAPFSIRSAAARASVPQVSAMSSTMSATLPFTSPMSFIRAI